MHREQNLLSGGRILDGQVKWRKLGYRDDGGPQLLKKVGNTLVAAAPGEITIAKKIGEIRRTSDGDINRTIVDKTMLNSVTSNVVEVNGVRKDLVIHDKKRRFSLVDQKDIQIPGMAFYKKNTLIYEIDCFCMIQFFNKDIFQK